MVLQTQMRDSSVKTTTFLSAAHILLLSHHWRRRRLLFCVKGDQAMDVLRTDHSAVNAVEWVLHLQWPVVYISIYLVQIFNR
ncbi:hypothetical protein TNCV_2274411 [Trichonephila clavipes]|nr:hypothetical protein TNCV_2274411 [Trichonephila clavipes]